MKEIKVGILGTGMMGAEHARRYAAIPGATVHACCDLDKKKAASFANEFSIPHVAQSTEELIDKCDAVSVVTPDASHAALSLEVLAAGKHLLCEKPLTTKLTDARRVARAATIAAQEGTVHMINFSYRDSSAVQEAMKLVERGELEDVRHVDAHYLQSWLSSKVWGDWQNSTYLWRLQTAKGSAGVLGDLGCHLLDLVTAVAGDLRALDCLTETFPKIDSQGKPRTTWRGAALDANDTAIMRLHYENGGLGTCHTTRWATGHMNSIVLAIHGTRGALRVDLDEGFDKLYVCLGQNRDKARWTVRTIRPTPNIHERFINSIRTGEPDQPDTIRGAQVQAYLDACERSAKKNGATMDVREWT